MTRIHIPAASLEAGAIAVAGVSANEFEKLSEFIKTNIREEARAAFEAMVEAWEGMYHEIRPGWRLNRIILPLPQEKPDDRD